MITKYTVDNLNSDELSIYSSISENQLAHIYEPKPGLFIAESSKVIERALMAGYEPVSMLIEKAQPDNEAQSALDAVNIFCAENQEYGDIPVYIADDKVFSNITGYKLTRGALCAMRRRPLPKVEDVINMVTGKDKIRIAILEDVENPTNLGAIFRSAAALNIDAIILTKGCADPLYRRAIRVSMGTVFQIPWTFFEYDDWMKALNNLGFKTASMALKKDTVSINDPVLKEIDKLAIVLGNEGNGLRDCTINGSDYTIKIPMSHNVDSLNVAAAAGIAFWELAGK